MDSKNTSQNSSPGVLDSVSAVGKSIGAKVSEAASSASATVSAAFKPTVGQQLDANVNAARTTVADTISPPQTIASKVAAAIHPSK
jgi:hypothetical protein